MILQQKTLEKLRNLINEETEYRSGPKLVAFFNELGFSDVYVQGFPSRWVFTDEKLSKINGTPEIDKCIKRVFAPVNFITRFAELDKFINDFNQYLAFDSWKVVRNEKEITFVKAGKINFETAPEIKEDDFLNREFKDISLDKLGLDSVITETLNVRFDEIKKCLNAKAPLSVIFLSGSTLEGILLGIASKHPKEFNQSKAAPKDREGKIKSFYDWSLSNYIDVASDLDFLKEDVKKFSHALRDFRNYIHPYEQVSSRFNPNDQTARICWQVLKAAIFQLCETKQ
ncbi:MAG TPA: hypothetical protein DCR40_11705 [Prolixibacteraceae bacterium]|nr:hypothetical protein [Prolixibacteraceae bacterium]